jgi:hypothetical protein
MTYNRVIVSDSEGGSIMGDYSRRRNRDEEGQSGRYERDERWDRQSEMNDDSQSYGERNPSDFQGGSDWRRHEGGFDRRQGQQRDSERSGSRGGFGREGQEFSGINDFDPGYGSYRESGFERGGYASQQEFRRGYGRPSGGFSRDYDYEGSYGMNDPYTQRQGGGQGRFGEGQQYGGYQSGYGFGQDEDSQRGRGQQRFGQQGQFYGRGPEGYTRSDERITEDVNERLTWHHDIDASRIRVRVEQGEVTLEGMVQDRSQKRMAEDVVESIMGVKNVQNNLRVGSGDSQSNGGQSNGGQPGASNQMNAQNDKSTEQNQTRRPATQSDR